MELLGKQVLVKALLDLLSGLITPEKGRIYTNYFDENSSKYISVNNDESPIKIAYIPQKVFFK